MRDPGNEVESSDLCVSVTATIILRIVEVIRVCMGKKTIPTSF